MSEEWPDSINPYVPPDQLKAAAKRGELVVFVGAGVSALCGSPLWEGFANAMVDQLAGHANLNFLALEQIKAIPDPRRRASVAIEIAKENGATLDFDKILHPSDPCPEGIEAYRHLGAIGPVFVTTNHDKWLHTAPSRDIEQVSKPDGGESAETPSPIRQIYCRREDLTVEKLKKPGCVIHLHGSCTAPETLVISLRQYMGHYGDDYVQTFLRQLFQEMHVLFVGYGMAELELLEYIVRYNPEPKTERHYLLFPYRSTEKVQLCFLRRYFENQCGVRLIPYCIDANGYAEVTKVLERWAQQISVLPPAFIARQESIDRALADSDSPPLRSAAIQALLEDPDLASYFFTKVQGSQWFSELRNAGFFDAKHNPAPRPGEDEHFWVLESWPALQYLERVAIDAHSRGDLALAGQVLEVISAITKPAEGSAPDNWRTWALLAKALAVLPIEAIKIEHIALVETWLTGRFDTTLGGHELGSKLMPRLLASNNAEDHAKAVALLNILTSFRKQDSGSDT